MGVLEGFLVWMALALGVSSHGRHWEPAPQTAEQKADERLKEVNY